MKTFNVQFVLCSYIGEFTHDFGPPHLRDLQMSDFLRINDGRNEGKKTATNHCNVLYTIHPVSQSFSK